MFDDVRLPLENRLGTAGEGFKFAMKGLDGGRLNIAACSLGGAQDALDRAQQCSGNPLHGKPQRRPGGANALLHFWASQGLCGVFSTAV